MIWILIAARSWQWAVVARNKHNFTFISFNAGTVKEYTVTWIIFILPPWRVTELVMERCGNLQYGRNREFTLILSVNSHLFDTWIHAYSIHEFTLIRCVNSRLFDAWMHACTKSQLTLVRSVKSCQRIQRILRFKSCYFAWPEYFLQPQPTASGSGLRLKFISLILLVFLMITKFNKRTKELWAAEIQIISIVFGTNITLFRNNSIFIQSIK